MGHVLNTHRSDHLDLRQLWRTACEVYDDPKLHGCGRRIRDGRAGSSREILYRVVNCRRTWTCPIHGYSYSRQLEDRFADSLDAWMGRGGAAISVTLTQRHERGDDLATLWDHLEVGCAATYRRKVSEKGMYGWRGYVWVPEIVYHHHHGWNPHSHGVVLLDRTLDAEPLARLGDSIASRYSDAVDHAGGSTELQAQSIRLMKPSEARTAARYLFKGMRVRRSDSSCSPMALLAATDAAASPTAPEARLLQQFGEAVIDGRRRARRHFHASNHFDEMCLAGPRAG